MHIRVLPLLLLGLLLLAACRPVATASLVPATPSPTSVPSDTPQPTPTVAPATPSPTRPLPTSTSAPTSTSPPATPTSEAGLSTPEIPPVPTSGQTANADVEYVRAVQAADGTWTFHVTVRHPDTGWEDYADGWDVVGPDGEVLKPDPSSPFTRLLLHPHETEQPFTRSQSGIAIPDDVSQVRVRAHDLVDGFGGREVVVDLTLSAGTNFEVERRP